MSAHLSERNRPLSARERETIRNRLKQNEEALTGRIVVPTNKRIGSEGMDPRRQGHYESFMRDDVKEDAGLIRANIARDKRILEAGDPHNIDRRQRQKIEKEVERDRAWVQKEMCPKTLFNVQVNHPDYQQAVKACMREHTEEYKRVASRLKENLRRLDPDGSSNLEAFRPNN
jgi:hypothetical protein